MIRRRQVLRDVEIVLGVLAAVVSGHRDRRHVVQGRVEPTRQADHRAGAIDVRGALRVLGGGEVVDGGAVHHVVDGSELGDRLIGQAEVRRGQVADQRFRALTPGRRGQPFEPRQRFAADQHPHLGVIAAGENLRNDSATNKPGTAGNDIAHAVMVAPRQAKVNSV